MNDHFPLFTQGRFEALAKATGVTLDHIQQACDALRKLNPKPGLSFVTDQVATVIPDLLVRKLDGHYDVELNDDGLPHVRISRVYYRMLRDPHAPPDAREFLAKRLRQAGWLTRAIAERHATVLAIGRCLISLQRAFLERGPQALVPLTQAQVASLVGRHPSTVSRAIAGKTMDTPYGIVPLEQLFAGGLPQPDANGQAGSVSDASIKGEIEQMITAEDAHRPLSDATIAQRLKARQIAVARRTVAKYRTSLKILPAHLRRRRF